MRPVIIRRFKDINVAFFYENNWFYINRENARKIIFPLLTEMETNLPSVLSDELISKDKNGEIYYSEYAVLMLIQDALLYDPAKEFYLWFFGEMSQIRRWHTSFDLVRPPFSSHELDYFVEATGIPQETLFWMDRDARMGERAPSPFKPTDPIDKEK